MTTPPQLFRYTRLLFRALFFIHHKHSKGLQAAVPIFVVALLVTRALAAPQETVLHNFNPTGVGGAFPYAGLITDAAGNRYGTTSQGGIKNCGTAFELSPNGGGGWTEKILHSFGRGTDGTLPKGGLIRDAAGNLYGTTVNGGIHNEGTAFELMPQEDGNWTEKVLHSFGNGNDGQNPYAGLIFDAAGNLYGTTTGGGLHGLGTVFELFPGEGGGWTEKVLRNFDPDPNAAFSYASLIFDASWQSVRHDPRGRYSRRWNGVRSVAYTGWGLDRECAAQFQRQRH